MMLLFFQQLIVLLIWDLLFCYNTIFGGVTTLQLSVGDVTGTNPAPGASISLDRDDTSSSILLNTDIGRIGYFKNNGSVGIGYDSNPDGVNSFTMGYNVRSQSYGETALGLWNTSGSLLSETAFDSFDRLLTVGNGAGSGSEHNAFTMWKDGSFAYNDDNFQNDNPGTEQNMFYFNYGNHDGLGNAQTKRAIRMGSVLSDEWDINSANVGDRSVAIGFTNDNSFYSLGPVASGKYSFAFGPFANASGERSFSFQTANQLGVGATGYGSIAMGYSVFASGDLSLALGYAAKAKGFESVSLGSSYSNGFQSFAFNGTSESFREINFGISTPYIPQRVDEWNNSDRLFTIGNGYAYPAGWSPASDALTILKNGQTGIGIDNFETNSNGNIFQVGDGSTNIIGYVDNVTGNWVAVSDERKKDNIADISYGLDQVLALQPKSFDYKRNHEHTIGFIAQQVLPIVPEAVYGSESEGYGMSYTTLTPVIVKAIQEMNLKITDINNTDTPNTWRDALIAWFENATNGIRKLFVGEVHTDTLCIGQTCVTESQLQQLLQSNQQVVTPSLSGNPPEDTNPNVVPDGTVPSSEDATPETEPSSVIDDTATGTSEEPAIQ